MKKMPVPNKNSNRLIPATSITTCGKCEVKFTLKHLGNLHRELCPFICKGQIKSSSMHGFIRNHSVFFAEVCSDSEVGGQGSSSATTEVLFIYLSPGAMDAMELIIGDFVMIFDVSGNVLFPASVLPYNSEFLQKNPLSAVFPSSYAKNNIFRGSKFIVVTKITRGYMILASKVCLKSPAQKSFFNDEGFLSYLQMDMARRSLLWKGQCLNVQYCGQSLPVTVEEGYGLIDQMQEPVKTLNINGLNTSLELLCLRDSGLDQLTSSTIDVEPCCSSAVSPEPDTPMLHQLQSPFTTDSDNSAGQSIPNFEGILKNMRFYSLNSNTAIEFNAGENSADKNSISFSDIGGVSTIKRALTAGVVTPCQKLITSKNLIGSQIFLLHGPSGCGKTLLGKSLKQECTGPYFEYPRSRSFSQNSPSGGDDFITDIMETFREAKNIEQPGVLFLDDIDFLFSKGSSVKDNDRRLIRVFCDLFDDVRYSKLFVVATCRAVDYLDISVRRRFDVELEVGPPSATDRLEILNILLRNCFSHVLTNQEIVMVADKAHGYTGADLLTVCRQAYANALARENAGEVTFLQLEDILEALCTVHPTAMKEVFVEVPKVYWRDIGGLETVKHQLRQAVEWPLKHAAAFERLGIRPPSGILLYGPPGCSKTMMAKAVATESGLGFIPVKGPELFRKFVGESEELIRKLFQRARLAAPCVLFFDEIDALAANRGSSSGGQLVGDRILTQLLTELDGIQSLSGVLFLAATNRPDVIDGALMRPGRIDRIIYIPLPDETTRLEILKLRLATTCTGADVDVGDLVKKTEGYSSAELVAVCNEAALSALTESLDISELSERHFIDALSHVTPRTDQNLLKAFEQFQLSSFR